MRQWSSTRWWAVGSMVLLTTGAVPAAAAVPEDAWRPTSTAGSPDPRYFHTAVWTGSKMVVWGGYSNAVSGHWTSLATGGVYDPQPNFWTPVSTSGAPEGRRNHTAVWTGSSMIVWGGWGNGEYALASGGVYEPGTNSWAPAGAGGAPGARAEHSAVWTGSKMIVWGGMDGTAGPVGTSWRLNTGDVYDPVDDTWSPMTTVGAPAARSRHTAVWTGSKMIVWGGFADGWDADSGGVYDPETDTWTAMSTDGAPSARAHHTAVWAGSRMIVWGGSYGTWDFDTGAVYDPSTDTWSPTSTEGAPSPRSGHTAVWTGSKMLVWGKTSATTGGVYDPVADTWAAMTTAGAPEARWGPSSVWTGAAMIVWGGSGGDVKNTGGIYGDPTVVPEAEWAPTSPSGAPPARAAHSTVWTGSRMIVWGGFSQGAPSSSGGVFDQASDTWSATSTVGAPDGRYFHTAVWTGSKMVIWGGWGDAGPLNTGGVYDPSTDVWTPTSTLGAPDWRRTTPRYGRARRWLSGVAAARQELPQHRRHLRPSTDTWTATTTVGAPSGRVLHTAVWTGSRMIVWGGLDDVGVRTRHWRHLRPLD